MGIPSSNLLQFQAQQNPFELLQRDVAQPNETEANEVAQLSASRQYRQDRNEIMTSPYSTSSRNRSIKQVLIGTGSKKLESLRKGHQGKTSASPCQPNRQSHLFDAQKHGPDQQNGTTTSPRICVESEERENWLQKNNVDVNKYPSRQKGNPTFNREINSKLDLSISEIEEKPEQPPKITTMSNRSFIESLKSTEPVESEFIQQMKPQLQSLKNKLRKAESKERLVSALAQAKSPRKRRPKGERMGNMSINRSGARTSLDDLSRMREQDEPNKAKQDCEQISATDKQSQVSKSSKSMFKLHAWQSGETAKGEPPAQSLDIKENQDAIFKANGSLQHQKTQQPQQKQIETTDLSGEEFEHGTNQLLPKHQMASQARPQSLFNTTNYQNSRTPLAYASETPQRISLQNLFSSISPIKTLSKTPTRLHNSKTMQHQHLEQLTASVSPTGPLPDEFKSRDKILRTPKRDKSENVDEIAQCQSSVGYGRGIGLQSPEESSKLAEEKKITPEVMKASQAEVVRKTEERSEGDRGISQEDCEWDSVEMAQYSPSQGRKMEYLLNQLASNISNTSQLESLLSEVLQPSLTVASSELSELRLECQPDRILVDFCSILISLMEEYSLSDPLRQNEGIIILNQIIIQILSKIVAIGDGVYILGQSQNQLQRLHVCLLQCQSIRAKQIYNTPSRTQRSSELSRGPLTQLLNHVLDLKSAISTSVDERILVWNIMNYIGRVNSYSPILNQENWSAIASTQMALVDLSDILEREPRLFSKESNIFETVVSLVKFHSNIRLRFPDINLYTPFNQKLLMKYKRSLYLVLEQIRSINKKAFRRVINSHINSFERAYYAELVKECCSETKHTRETSEYDVIEANNQPTRRTGGRKSALSLTLMAQSRPRFEHQVQMRVQTPCSHPPEHNIEQVKPETVEVPSRKYSVPTTNDEVAILTQKSGDAKQENANKMMILKLNTQEFQQRVLTQTAFGPQRQVKRQIEGISGNSARPKSQNLVNDISESKQIDQVEINETPFELEAKQVQDIDNRDYQFKQVPAVSKQQNEDSESTTLCQTVNKDNGKSHWKQSDEVAVSGQIHDGANGPPIHHNDIGNSQQLQELLGSDRIRDLAGAIREAFEILRTNHNAHDKPAEYISVFYAILGELVGKTNQKALITNIQVLFDEFAETELLLPDCAQHHRHLLSSFLAIVPPAIVYQALAALLLRPEPTKHLSPFLSFASFYLTKELEDPVYTAAASITTAQLASSESTASWLLSQAISELTRKRGRAIRSARSQIQACHKLCMRQVVEGGVVNNNSNIQ